MQKRHKIRLIERRIKETKRDLFRVNKQKEEIIKEDGGKVKKRQVNLEKNVPDVDEIIVKDMSLCHGSML